MHTGMQTYVQVCWWMFVSFLQRCYSPGAGEKWQMVECESEFQSGLTEVSGCGVSRVECGRRCGQSKAEEVQGQVKKEYVSCGWRNGESCPPLNPREKYGRFSTEAKVRSDITDIRCLGVENFHGLAGPRTLGGERGELGDLQVGDDLLITEVGKSFAAFLSWDLQSNNQSPADCKPTWSTVEKPTRP